MPGARQQNKIATGHGGGMGLRFAEAKVREKWSLTSPNGTPLGWAVHPGKVAVGSGEMVLLQPSSSAVPTPPRELVGGHRHFPTDQREVSSRGQQAICTYMGCPWLADVWPAKDRDVRAAAEGSNYSCENLLALGDQGSKGGRERGREREGGKEGGPKPIWGEKLLEARGLPAG